MLPLWPAAWDAPASPRASALRINTELGTVSAGGVTPRRRPHNHRRIDRPSHFAVRSPCVTGLTGDFAAPWKGPTACRDEGSYQCRYAERCRRGPEVRSGRHRALPHRAHVFDATRIMAMREMIVSPDESGRRTALAEAPAYAAPGLRRVVPNHGGPAGHDPFARSAAPRIPAAP